MDWKENCDFLDLQNKLRDYERLGTVDQLSKKIDEDDVLKFYYCESLGEYYIGKRCDNFYYAKPEINQNGDICLHYEWSRYLPWGEHIKKPRTVWKEFTYPSEPKEISFEEWLKGFIGRLDNMLIK